MCHPGLADSDEQTKDNILRILQMIASLAESGGAEMLVRNLSLEFAAQGHDCHIVYIADAGSLGASESFERGFKEQMDAAGIGYTMLGAEVRRRPWLGAWRLRRAVRAFRPDILHMHLGWALIFQALAVLRMPTVYTHHNIVFKFSPRLFRLFDHFVDRYVAICEPCRLLLDRYVRRPIVTIPNGVPAHFAARRHRDELPRNLSILSVGNLTPQKDYPNLIEAAQRVSRSLAAQGRSVTFRIAGEGPERKELERQIAAAGLVGTVLLLGARRDVPQLMEEADLLVLASQYEGLPITLIEAAMSGLPVVATDVGGCAEIVSDNETGLLVPASDPDRLAAAVLSLLSDGERYSSFARRARERASRFTLASCADAHLRLYDGIKQRHRPEA